ncbi:DUF4097 family beta strand repeat-containing protein [Silanimonas sp.]|jgi:hypothetical protein|uniref:DUF4097 family beta strand repeat-containing protein n=1 Tax=Silanimonas sp. TaxID=1929290 RepID=UPI0037CC9149
MPRAVALLGLIAALAAAPSPAAVVNDERALAPGQVMHLRIEAGEVTVRPGDAGKAVVEADLAPGQRLVWREAFDRRVLAIDDGERLRARPVRVELRVPADASLRLQLGDATLDLDGVGGASVVIRGGRGDVRVVSTAELVDIDTVAGRIEAEVEGSRLRAHSVDGAQRLAVAGAGGVAATTVSGALGVRLANGAPIRLASVSGAIDLSLDATEDLDAKLETLSGDVGIRVQAGQPFVTRIAQAQGDVALPGGIVQRPDGTLAVGDGGGALRVASFSGAIDIAIRTEPAAATPPANADTP